jgi:hypothetical protein
LEIKSTQTRPGNTSSSTITDRNNTQKNTFLFGPSISIQPKISGKLHFKGDVNLSFVSGKGTYSFSNFNSNGGGGISNYTSEIGGIQFEAVPGLIFFASRGIAISCSLGGLIYNKTEEEYFDDANTSANPNPDFKYDNSYSEFSFNPSNFSLAFHFLFPSKEKIIPIKK